jgi:hypothetical protein
MKRLWNADCGLQKEVLRAAFARFVLTRFPSRRARGGFFFFPQSAMRFPQFFFA